MGVENNAMFRLGCRFACCDVESECTVCCDALVFTVSIQYERPINVFCQRCTQNKVRAILI